MREVDFKIYKKLSEDGGMSKSRIPSTVERSNAFNNLLNAEILDIARVGRGLKVFVNKKEEFEKFFKTTFPNQQSNKSKSGNIKKYKNSKATIIKNQPIFLFRGFDSALINDKTVDLKTYTQDFGVFATIPNSVECKKICFVENLEAFLNTEKLLSEDYIFIHKYGRIGKQSIQMFKADEILVFVDYDFNGLDEFLRIKEVFDKAELFVPKDYDKLFVKYAFDLKKNKAKMSKRVINSNEPIVIKIREQVARSNKFLEQEILINV
jgi:hypothetical protein